MNEAQRSEESGLTDLLYCDKCGTELKQDMIYNGFTVKGFGRVRCEFCGLESIGNAVDSWTGDHAKTKREALDKWKAGEKRAI